MPRGKGHPYCNACGGSGVVRAVNGYVPCRCIRGSKESRDWYSRLQSPDGRRTASELVARLRKRYDS